MLDRKRTYHGVSIGILMLDTSFERFNGDIGNARAWPSPCNTASCATQPRTASRGPRARICSMRSRRPPAGVDGITTTCGFLALYQKYLAAHYAVPVVTSPLLQVPMVARILPGGKRPAILTFSAESLTLRHPEAVGVD